MLNNTISLVSTLTISLSNNSNYKYCSERFSTLQCYLIILICYLPYLLLAFSLFPQIIHLFNYRTRYIAGVSYVWITIRILALTLLMVGHTSKWLSIFEFIAIISTIIIFSQIIIFSKSLHRQNKLILIIISALIWIIGGSIIFFFIEQKKLLLTVGYLSLAGHMLPQILLNSFLRTAKALSKFSILLLTMSDILLFLDISKNHLPSINLISIYYSFSFYLFIYVQSIVYADAHIHIISRSEHTVLTPGVDIFTGLDTNIELVSIGDGEPMDEDDIVYQSVIPNKSSLKTTEKIQMKRFVWYAILGWIFCIETICTVILIYHVRSPWIIFVPISIPFILGIFFLLRTKLSILQTETLRRIL